MIPLYGTSYTTCIGCDTTFNEMINIKEDCVRQTGTVSLTGPYNTRNVSDTAFTKITSQSQNTLQQRPIPPDNTQSVANNSNMPVGSVSQTARHAQNHNSQQNRTSKLNIGNRDIMLTDDGEDGSWISTSNSSENRLDQSIASRHFHNTNNRSNTWGNIDNDAEIMCNCHETAIQLTVKKEGPNKGEMHIFLIYCTHL